MIVRVQLSTMFGCIVFLGCGDVGGVVGEWVEGLDQGLEGWGGDLCEL